MRLTALAAIVMVVLPLTAQADCDGPMSLISLMRNTDAACKDEGIEKQKQTGDFYMCQENHQQLVEAGAAR